MILPGSYLGTTSPIWLNGSHPQKINETTKMEACVRFSQYCCLQHWDVEAKKCSTNNEEFFVYYLKPTVGCPMRYCAGIV